MKLFKHAIARTSLCCAVMMAFLPTQVLATPAEEVTPPSSPVAQTLPSAQPKDVQSLDGIVYALYDVISGGMGEKRDWNRMRSLFIPEARIMAIAPKQASKPENQELQVRLMTLSDYIAELGPGVDGNWLSRKRIATPYRPVGRIGAGVHFV